MLPCRFVLAFVLVYEVRGGEEIQRILLRWKYRLGSFRYSRVRTAANGRRSGHPRMAMVGPFSSLSPHQPI